MDDKDIYQMFLPMPRGPVVRADIHDPATGEVLGQVEISEIEHAPTGEVVYQVTVYYFDGVNACKISKMMRVPRWQSLNVMGMLVGALTQFRYEDMCSDDYPREAYGRAQGSGSVIPAEVVEKG